MMTEPSVYTVKQGPNIEDSGTSKFKEWKENPAKKKNKVETTREGGGKSRIYQRGKTQVSNGP